MGGHRGEVRLGLAMAGRGREAWEGSHNGGRSVGGAAAQRVPERVLSGTDIGTVTAGQDRQDRGRDA